MLAASSALPAEYKPFSANRNPHRHGKIQLLVPNSRHLVLCGAHNPAHPHGVKACL
jgi:hypothetical protein